MGSGPAESRAESTKLGPTGVAGQDVLALAATLRARGQSHALLTVVRAVKPTSGKPGDKALLTADGQWVGWVGGSCAEPSARRLALATLQSGEATLLRLTNDSTEAGGPGVHVLPMSCFSGGVLDVFVEPFCASPRLFVLGDAPVAHALQRLGQAMAWTVQSASHLPEELGDGWPSAPPAGCAVVVACHGRQERGALRWALEGEAQYVGLVASRRRGEVVRKQLLEAGVGSRKVARLDSPAGLDIGGRGAQEVALSIVAAMVARRRTQRPAHCPLHAVLVAAGLSRRMGAVNKLLVPLDGVPMVRRTAERLCETGFSEVVVVVGFEREAVVAALAGLPVRIVFNENFERGQQTSVRAGLAALPQGVEGAMVCLADQPWLEVGDLLALWNAFDERPTGQVVVPRFEGRRGNPVVMSSAAIAESLKSPEPAAACRTFIASDDERVHYWSAPSDHFVRDVDSPQDCEAAMTGAGPQESKA